MILLNDHFHCRCSPDSSAPLADMCRAAESVGIYDVCLTDHCDVVGEHGEMEDSFSWTAEDAELAAAFQYPVHVRRGVELGQAIWNKPRAEEVLRDPNIDFVLGSIHNTRSGLDFYWVHFTTLSQCRQLLTDYFCDLLELARTDYYDSLAHLTYPVRYMTGRDGVPIKLIDFEEQIIEILKVLIEKGKSLELNTSGFRIQEGWTFPPDWVLRRYRELGGELVTIGSDAHTPEDFACGIREGMEMLKECGFRYVTKYVRRVPNQILIE